MKKENIEKWLTVIGIFVFINTLMLGMDIIGKPIFTIQHINETCNNKVIDTSFETSTNIDYNNLNYTVLNITREEFMKLSLFRQQSWLNGECYPLDCKIRNPPVCTMVYATYCYNSDNPTTRYFNEQKLEKK